ncbi:MAG: Holliday junction branch migration protein RuvA [Blastochloris sp.]|nr:Holliday junction branch migration protein RuvA [Blastochloris sp.]
MIAFLKGTLMDVLPNKVILEVRDIGYELLIPLSTFDRLPQPGQNLLLHTYLQVREDAHLLYGFFSRQERDLFLLLINTVSGVGPKLALAVLSGCSPDQFQSAVALQDVAYLSKIKGLGKKTAERIVLELKDKVGLTATLPGGSPSSAPADAGQKQLNDAVLALIALGYKQPDAIKAVTSVGGKASLEETVREALKAL